MIIDSKGKLFEERRKKERRKNEFNTKEEKRAKTDRRNPKNAYKPEE
jgi:hypothetical protein